MQFSMSQPIKVPKISRLAGFYALLLIVFPNVAFLMLAWLTNTARPIVNLDYFIVALLLVMPIRLVRWIGMLLFWLVVLFDSLMFIMQLFPFMDFSGALYLAPFILKAPLLYKLTCLVFLLYIIGIPVLLSKFSKKTNFFHVLLVCLPLTIIGYFTGHLQYHYRTLYNNNAFGRDNFYYVKSQFELYRINQADAFIQESGVAPVFSQLKFDRAANRLIQPYSRRILFITNESWGQPKNPALQEAVLAKLMAERSQFEYWQIGHFPFVGATVQGEVRELCGLGVKGFALKHTPTNQLVSCLPNKLKQQGYTTVAMHGASSLLYDRSSWYPKAGFGQVIAGEQMIGKPTCLAFGGVCDSALFDKIQQTFATHEKLFFYWMTLTSHADYPEQDLFNHRLQCEQYGLPKETSLCRNFSLQTQFFDGLAELIKQPEMRGVEVIVVGDHSPPVMNLGESFKYLTEGGEVAWIHFKVKE